MFVIVNVFVVNVFTYTNTLPVSVFKNVNASTKLGHAASTTTSFNHKSNKCAFFLNAIANSFALSKDLSVP